MTPANELESLRGYIEERWPCIDPKLAWELRCRIRKAIEDAGLQIRQFAQRQDYGCETARYLAKKHSDLYHITPRDERLTCMGVALERITEADIEELRTLDTLTSRGPWGDTLEYCDDDQAGGLNCITSMGPSYKYNSPSTREVALEAATNDARFADAVRAKLPALLHELRRAREALRDLVEALGKDDLPRREAIARARWQLMQWEPDSTEDAP